MYVYIGVRSTISLSFLSYLFLVRNCNVSTIKPIFSLFHVSTLYIRLD